MADRLTGKPIHLDISDLPMKKESSPTEINLFSALRKWKIIFTNHMVRQYYEQGAHVLLIDTGNSYQGLCELIREKQKSVMVCILPIQRKTLLLLILFIPMTEFLILRKESIKTLILTLWKRDDEPPEDLKK